MAIPPYISELRALVGQRYLLVASVTAAIFDDDDRLLVVRISGRSEPFWTFPGGLIEPDERPLDALHREVAEETGLQIVVDGIVGMHAGPEFRHTYSNGDEAGYIMGTYLCRPQGGRERPDGDEIAELAWVTREEALKLPAGRWFALVVRDAFEARSQLRLADTAPARP